MVGRGRGTARPGGLSHRLQDYDCDRRHAGIGRPTAERLLRDEAASSRGAFLAEAGSERLSGKLCGLVRLCASFELTSAAARLDKQSPND